MIAYYVLQKINVPFVIVVLCWQTMELHVRFSMQQALQFVLHQIIKYWDLTPLQLLSSVSLGLSSRLYVYMKELFYNFDNNIIT